MEILGITNPAQDAPGYVHSWIVTPDTKMVSKNNTMTLINQDKRPNVMRFIGMKSIFKMGVIRSMRRLNTRPANIRTCHPPDMVSAGRI